MNTFINSAKKYISKFIESRYWRLVDDILLFTISFMLGTIYTSFFIRANNPLDYIPFGVGVIMAIVFIFLNFVTQEK